MHDQEHDQDQEHQWCREERCEPLGADTDTALSDDEAECAESLREERELLSSSLFSITSHLAQVQFRLRQIVDAPPGEKEKMLESLEEFTLRGVPEIGAVVEPRAVGPGLAGEDAFFVEKLRRRLAELEEGGDARREPIVGEIKSGMEEWVRGAGSPESALRRRADGLPSDPTLLAAELQSRVEEMQRFIEFLKSSPSVLPDLRREAPATTGLERDPDGKTPRSVEGDLRAETLNLVRKIVTLMRAFGVSRFGCASDPFGGAVVRAPPPPKWGGLLAALDASVERILELVKKAEIRSAAFDDYDSDSEEGSATAKDVSLTAAVRKRLAMNVRDLVQHGLIDVSDVGVVAPFVGCFPLRRSVDSKRAHAWDLVLKYYELNNGDGYNSTPARRLSQSFNLDIVGGAAISNRQSMLSAIGAIIASHAPYRRSRDSHFKAFVCAGLNARGLVPWLALLFKNKTVVRMCYSATSYVANTGFQDALRSLDRLTPYAFDLPVDLAVRQFQNIKDVFM